MIIKAIVIVVMVIKTSVIATVLVNAENDTSLGINFQLNVVASFNFPVVFTTTVFQLNAGDGGIGINFQHAGDSVFCADGQIAAGVAMVVIVVMVIVHRRIFHFTGNKHPIYPTGMNFDRVANDECVFNFCIGNIEGLASNNDKAIAHIFQNAAELQLASMVVIVIMIIIAKVIIHSGVFYFAGDKHPIYPTGMNFDDSANQQRAFNFGS